MKIDHVGSVAGSADWKMAVRAAAARLSEHLGSRDDPVAAALANELAALLCAYGLVDEELERMRARDPASDFGLWFGRAPLGACQDCPRLRGAELQDEGREIGQAIPDYH